MAGLAATKFILGDSNGDPAAVSMSGDGSLSNTGVLTVTQSAGDFTVTGNLLVSGDSVTVNTANMNVEDPLIQMGKNNGADAVDLGFAGKYTADSTVKYAGLFRDATDGKFRLFKDAEEDLSSATTVNISGAGYARAELVCLASSSSQLETGRTLGMTGDVVWTSPAFNGTGNVTAAASIQDDKIKTAMISDGQVTLAKLAADSVDGSKIVDDAINSEHYADGSIDTAHIADAQVTLAKLAADSVDGSKIVNDAINSEHYADGSIDTAHIADAQVTLAKLAADSVDQSKIANSAVQPEHFHNDCFGGGITSDSGKMRLLVVRDSYPGSQGSAENILTGEDNNATVAVKSFTLNSANAVVVAGAGGQNGPPVDQPDPNNLLQVYFNGILQDIQMYDEAQNQGNRKLEQNQVDCLMKPAAGGTNAKLYFLGDDVSNTDSINVYYMS
jgi:hypothetical protein